MSTDNNIMNAFKVVSQTYANVKKMFDELDEIAENNNAQNIVSSKPNFLRWRTDLDTQGWYLGSLIKLFQKKDSDYTEDNSILRNDDIYGMDVVFWNSTFNDSPEVILAKYEYNANTLNGKAPNISEHWMFYQPLKRKDLFGIKEKSGLNISIPKKGNSNKFGDLKQVTFKHIKLIDITTETIGDKFKELISM